MSTRSGGERAPGSLDDDHGAHGQGSAVREADVLDRSPAEAAGLAVALPPEPTTRPEDVALHDDVRWLAAALGRVIRRLEGDQAFQTVDELRRACRARRRGAPDAPSLDALLDRVDALPLDMSAVAARAFTLFFLLINTAEQVHRVRRRRDYLR